MLTADTPLTKMPGIGERRAAQLAKLGLHTVEDLVLDIPRDYEDWSSLVSITGAPFGEDCCIKAQPVTLPQEHRIRRGMTLYRFQVSDGETVMKITLFNNPYAAKKIRRGQEYLFFGTVGGTLTQREMTAPRIEEAGNGQRIRPLYHQTEGLTSRVIERLVREVLDHADALLDTDCLPEDIRKEKDLYTRRRALQQIHFPDDRVSLGEARRRLAFEELLVLQLGLLRLKGRNREDNAARMVIDDTAAFEKLLPFTLTGAQKRAIADCVADLQGDHVMNRLLQGDVGSGKTAVAACLAFVAARNGFQTALMAPTEILAQQHARSLATLLEPAGLRVALLTGSLPAAARREVYDQLTAGHVHVAVGTQALLSEGVAFAHLGLVITDEQHRFGVRQRAQLAAKGIRPHILVMSATPIPRTLALMIYGDLDVSVLDELPPGRQPIATYAVSSRKRERAYAYVRRHLDEGRQAYVVCPLVESPEEEGDLAAATAYAQQLADGPLKGYTVGLLHGRMKAADKQQVMADFSRNVVSVLVSTTVVEVGVDVPNAVIMVIENAERFGLAQLHQLRGRVGRGQHASTCILISDARSEEAVRRLKVMCSTNDGFRIADEDLKLRGPGDFFGRRQHGLPALRLANLSDDLPLVREAQESARGLLADDPDLERTEHRALRQAVETLFAQVGEQGLN